MSIFTWEEWYHVWFLLLWSAPWLKSVWSIFQGSQGELQDKNWRRVLLASLLPLTSFPGFLSCFSYTVLAHLSKDGAITLDWTPMHQLVIHEMAHRHAHVGQSDGGNWSYIKWSWQVKLIMTNGCILLLDRVFYICNMPNWFILLLLSSVSLLVFCLVISFIIERRLAKSSNIANLSIFLLGSMSSRTFLLGL